MDRAKKITPNRPTPPPSPTPSAIGGWDLSELPLPQRIAFLRGRRGQSQKQLGELAGRSESWLSKVERGERPCDSLEAIISLAVALRVPPAVLIDIDLNAVPEGWSAESIAQDGGAQRGPSVTAAGWTAGIREALDGLAADLRRVERRITQINARPAARNDDLIAASHDGASAPEDWPDDGDDKASAIAWLVVRIDGRPVLVPMRLPRRKLLGAGSAALLTGLTSRLDRDELGRLTAVITDPARTDHASVAHLEALLEHYRRLDDVIGPRHLLALVTSAHALVTHLAVSAAPPVRRALAFVSAQYLKEIGWLWTDSGDHKKALAAYDEAIVQATQAGEHALARYVMVCESDLILVEGRPAAALDLAQAAQDGDGLSPAVRAYAAMFEARTWAVNDQRGPCERKLEQATALLADGAERRDEEPPWIYYFGEEALAAQRGVCLTDLGEAATAVKIFDRALPRLPGEQVRDRAYPLIWLAKAHAGNRDLEPACLAAQEAARIAIETGSKRILEQLVVVHTELVQAGQDVGAVQELGDLLRTVGTGSAAVVT